MPKYVKEDLEKLVQNYMQHEIAEMYGTSQQYISIVLRRFGIATPPMHERNAKINITPRMKEVIIGTALGDGCIQLSNGVNSYLRIEQGERQTDYAQWKLNELQSMCKCTELRQTTHLDKRRGTVSKSVYFQTKTHPYMTELRKIFYPAGKKVIPSDFDKYLTELTLAVWYMDDGTKAKIQNQATLCVQGFYDDEISYIQEVLKSKFNLNTVLKTIYDKRYKQYETNITFNSASFIMLMELMDKYKIPCLEYKFEKQAIYPKIQKEIDALATTMCQSPSQADG